MSDVTLGKLVEGNPGRDAIHVAVIPMVAGEDLLVAQPVKLIQSKAFDHGIEGAIGIVDPFLKKTVKTGQKFWLCLYPKTVTSLRHEWVHPAFDAKPETSADMQWLMDFAEQLGIDYDDLMDGANEWIISRNYLCEHGSENWRSMYSDEFWDHYAAATGVKVGDGDRQNFFTCSC